MQPIWFTCADLVVSVTSKAQTMCSKSGYMLICGSKNISMKYSLHDAGR